MKATCAFFLSAKADSALTPREPRAGTARGIPASGSLPVTGTVPDLASLAADAAALEVLPAALAAAAAPLVVAAAELEDESPLELDEPEEAAAPPFVATAADELVEEELELPSPEEPEAPLEPEAAAAPPPHSLSQLSSGATTATEDEVPELEDALEPS